MKSLVIKILGLIPIKKLEKYLPEIIAFLLNKLMRYLSKRKPEKLQSVIDVSKKVVEAMETTLKAGEDKVFTPKELEEIYEAWQAVLKGRKVDFKAIKKAESTTKPPPKDPK